MLNKAGTSVSTAVKWVFQEEGFTWRIFLALEVGGMAAMLFIIVPTLVGASFKRGFAETLRDWSIYLDMGAIWLILGLVILPLASLLANYVLFPFLKGGSD